MTRFALIGGIYSNWRALEATLADIARRQVDATYCLGAHSGPGNQLVIACELQARTIALCAIL